MITCGEGFKCYTLLHKHLANCHIPFNVTLFIHTVTDTLKEVMVK